MIDFEHYLHLMEVVSLDNQIGSHLKNIECEKTRVITLNEKKSSRKERMKFLEEKLTSTRQKIQKLEIELANIQKNLERTKKNLPHITSSQQLQAAEKELESISKKKTEIEDLLLANMEDNEQFENELTNIKSFLQGIDASISEIAQDVKDIISKEEHSINNYQLRINSLLDNCWPPLKDLFLAVNKKYRFKKPLAVVDNNYCKECRIRIPFEDQMHLEKGTSIVSCGGCGRILIPSKCLS